MGFLLSVFDMDSSEYSIYGEFAWAVKLNRFCLDLAGIWPKTNDATNSNLASNLRMGSTFIITIFIFIIPLIWSLIRVWGDIIFMIENLQVTLPIMMVLIKLVIIRWKRSVFSCIVEMMEEDWKQIKVDAERYVMMKQTRNAALTAICTYIATVFGFIALIVLPLFGLSSRHTTNLTDGERALPLQGYYYFDTDKSPQFELMCMFQSVGMLLCATTYTSVDTFFGFVIFHICGQLENFRHRLNNLSLWNDFNRALRNNVENHLRLIRFAGNIEEMFALLILVLVLIFSIAFCVYGFLFLNMIANSDVSKISVQQVIFVASGTFILFFHTFLYCGAGEIVASQCEAVYRAICDLHWYTLDSAKAKAIMLLMVHATEPFHITAGKIFPLTMTTFCSLLKTSAGYMSFLLASGGKT